MEWMSAIVRWLTLEEGGRRAPPTGEEPPIYWSVVKLVGNNVESQPNSWSLYVRMKESLENGYLWKAEVKFRVAEAPHHLLTDGVHFELYEGPKKVAIGSLSDTALTSDVSDGER